MASRSMKEASVSSAVESGGRRRAGGSGVENSVQKQVMDQGERRACHAVESSAHRNRLLRRLRTNCYIAVTVGRGRR